MLRLIALLLAITSVFISFGLALAHGEPNKANITLAPGEPRVGENAKVLVRLMGANTGSPLTGADVRMVGDMTGHTMKPVEVALTPTGTPGEYAAPVAFTMSGRWVLKLTVTHQGEHAQLVVETSVRNPDSAGDSSELSQSLSFLLEPDPPSYPLLILTAAVALIIGLMAMAIIRRRLPAPSSQSIRRDV